MAPEITFAGVYVDELPGDARVITGVPTGIAAFIAAVSIIIEVGFAPLRPAEFIVLTIRRQSAATP